MTFTRFIYVLKLTECYEILIRKSFITGWFNNKSNRLGLRKVHSEQMLEIPRHFS